MALTKQEIIDYASQYSTPEEITDFPYDGDLFCLLSRNVPEGKVLSEEEGWSFQGYGVCAGYLLDEEAKPLGKWLWMHFASLTTFPPSPQVFKLQPPHVVRGRFFDPSRTHEFRIVKVSLSSDHADGNTAEQPAPAPTSAAARQPSGKAEKGKIVQFRKKKV
jgi:hypothetical protein